VIANAVRLVAGYGASQTGTYFGRYIADHAITPVWGRNNTLYGFTALELKHVTKEVLQSYALDGADHLGDQLGLKFLLFPSITYAPFGEGQGNGFKIAADVFGIGAKIPTYIDALFLLAAVNNEWQQQLSVTPPTDNSTDTALETPDTVTNSLTSLHHHYIPASLIRKLVEDPVVQCVGE